MIALVSGLWPLCNICQCGSPGHNGSICLGAAGLTSNGAIYIDSSDAFTPALGQKIPCFQDSSSTFLRVAVGEKVIQPTGMA